MRFKFNAIVAIAVLVSFSGCGGGGETVPPPPKPPAGQTDTGGSPAKVEPAEQAAKDDSETAAPVPAGKMIAVPDAIVAYIYKPIEGVTLSTEQKQKADNLIMSRGGEFKSLRERRRAALTDELRKKRTAAIKKANSEGGDAAAAEKAAVGEEVYAKLKQIADEQNAIIADLRQSVKDMLTKEQIKLLNAARAARK